MYIVVRLILISLFCIFFFSQANAQNFLRQVESFNSSVKKAYKNEVVSFSALISLTNPKRKNLSFVFLWISSQLNLTNLLPDLILRPTSDFVTRELSFNLFLPKKGIFVFIVLDTDNSTYQKSLLYLSPKTQTLRLSLAETQSKFVGYLGCQGVPPKDKFQVCQNF
jgi:hypothetical protein